MIYLFHFTPSSDAQLNDFTFYPFKDDSGWSLKYVNGDRLFEEYYDSILVRDKNKIRVRKGEFWGVIDSTGKQLISFNYNFIKNDEYGYIAYEQYSFLSSIQGFLSFQEDTIVPFGRYSIFTHRIGEGIDYLLTLVNDDQEQAVFSSDGIQRTSFNYSNIVGIDSAKLFRLGMDYNTHYFALETLSKTYGIYNAVEKKIVAEPIYDDVCFSSCYQAINPHKYLGPIVYTGKAPVFIMSKKDHPVVIKTTGEIIYESDTLSYSKYKQRYYLSENGLITSVEGECVDRQDLPPPYVMKEEGGYFLVNHNGSYYGENKKHHDFISKNLYSEQPEGAIYFQIEDKGKVGLMNKHGEWKLPQVYDEVTYTRSSEGGYFRAKRAEGDYTYFDLSLRKLNTAPGIKKEFPRISIKDSLYGILSKDSTWLVEPVYNSYDFIFDSNIENITGYIFQKENKYIEIFNKQFEKTNDFKAELYQLVGNYHNNEDKYIFLYENRHLSLYNLGKDKWLFKGESYKMPVNKYINHIDNDIYFVLDDYSNNTRIFDRDGEIVFETQNSKDTTMVSELVTCESSPLILRKYYFNMEKEIIKIQYQNSNGNIINVNEGNNSKNYYLTYNNVANVYLLISTRSTSIQEIKVYDSDFKLKRIVEGHYKSHGRFYSVRNNTKQCSFYGANDSLLKILECNWLYKIENSSSIYMIDEGVSVLINDFTLREDLKYYRGSPVSIGRKGVFMVHLLDDETHRLVDVYGADGTLVLKGYSLKFSGRQFQNSKYYVFENDRQEVWLTENGVKYHLNEK